MTSKLENREEAARHGIFWHMVTGTVGEWAVRCGCGAGLTKAWSPARDVELMVKQFRKIGWVVKRGCGPTCPACVEKQKEFFSMSKPTIQPAENAPVAHIGGPAPKISRQIVTLLNDYFDDDGRRYLPEWSDERIAQEVDCHISVVQKMRREAYGELSEDPEVSSMREKIDELRLEAQLVTEDFGARIGELQKWFDEWSRAKKIAG